MVIIMMLLAVLGVHPYCDPMTAEEKVTKECHEYCDRVEARIAQHVSDCKTITDTGTGAGIGISNHPIDDTQDRN